MSDVAHPIRPFYAAWQTYNQAMTDTVRALTDDQLALRATKDQWPIWATVAHVAGTRVYWLCGIVGEAGAETTPFPDPLSPIGWEDNLDHPRSAAELVTALSTTWALIDGCLGRWTPDMLGELFVRDAAAGRERHSRGQLLLRFITHDAYHSGEISQILGANGLPPVDLWKPDRVDPWSDRGATRRR
jgi:uncharacterized damage-inducible protein DinB